MWDPKWYNPFHHTWVHDIFARFRVRSLADYLRVYYPEHPGDLDIIESSDPKAGVVNLNWTATRTLDGFLDGSVTSYTIYRATRPIGYNPFTSSPFALKYTDYSTKVATIPASLGATWYSFRDNIGGILPDGRYYYAVVANNGTGASIPSACIWIDFVGLPPPAPKRDEPTFQQS